MNADKFKAQYSEQVEKIPLLVRDHIVEKQEGLPKIIYISYSKTVVYFHAHKDRIIYKNYGYFDFPLRTFVSAADCQTGIYIDELAERINQLLENNYFIKPMIIEYPDGFGDNAYGCDYLLINYTP